MSSPHHRLRTGLAALAFAAASLIAGCAAPVPYTASHVELPFDEATNQASDGLVAQAQALSAFRFRGWFGRHAIVIDPMLDAGSGQRTATTEKLQQRVAQRLQAGLAGAEVLPFETKTLSQADYLVTGTLTRRNEGLPPDTLLLNLALTDLKTRTVAAQSWAVVRDQNLDATPTRYDSDSPVVLHDRVIDGYVATTAAAVGRPADPDYLKNLAVAPDISAGQSLYNAEKYAPALDRFKAAQAGVGGEQLRTLSGVYLSLAKTGESAAADDAFARLAAYGLANDQLRVKFLFNPGSTTFWSDPQISGPYAMWLRKIAEQAVQGGRCVNVIGHTSHTGTAEYNDTLSLQRADTVRERLVGENQRLAVRTGTEGRGFRENLVGSGTDDAKDALDRRVEFRVVPCN